MNKISCERDGDLVDQFCSQFKRTRLSVKTHIVKLKMMKNEVQNIPVKMIQKTLIQT